MKHLLCYLALIAGCGSLDATKHYTAHPTQIQQQVKSIPVAIDISFSPQEQAHLIAAVDEWNSALNGQMRLTIYTIQFDMEENTISYIYNSGGMMLLKVSSVGNVMYHMEPNTVAMASHIGTGHEIYFLKEKIENRLYRVALHEIAHILGAYHTQSGLMQHAYDAQAYSCIDYDTVQQVATYHDLDVNKMNWCQ